MIQISDLREREVVNIKNGKRLGVITDFEINLDTGKIDAFFIPGPGKILGIFGKNNDYWIPWQNISVIGEDVILVEAESAEEVRPKRKGDEAISNLIR